MDVSATSSAGSCAAREPDEPAAPEKPQPPPPPPVAAKAEDPARQGDARKASEDSAEGIRRAIALMLPPTDGPARSAGEKAMGGVANGTKLERGSRGEDVSALQTRLNELGYDAGAVDGAFGKRTAAAVREFQSRNNLDRDGVVGRRTLPKLQSADAQPASKPASKPAPVTPPVTAPVTPPVTAPVTPPVAGPVTPPVTTGAAVVPPVGGPSDASRSALAGAVNQGYQYLIGTTFPDAARQLSSSGSKGLAIVDKTGATAAGVAALKAKGITPYAYNNAFQTQPGEKLPPGVKEIDRDRQWNEIVPDFTDKRWQDRRIGEAVAAAKLGFDGVMLDNVPRAGESKAAAEFVKRMVVEARAASGNQKFGVILQNGEQLAKANPSLLTGGYVAGLQKEDVSFRVTGAGTGTGVAVDADERRQIKATYDALRRDNPNLVTIAVDYPRNAAQAEAAQAAARELGFNVSHVAIGDGTLSRISARTRTVRRALE